MLARLLPLLAILLCLGASPPPPDPFLPSKHGFKFRNGFTGSPIPPPLRALGLELDGRFPERFGLCGGMSIAAADYFWASKPVPADTEPPKEGTPLYNYLYQRQTDSLGALCIMAAKFAQWMSLPDTSETGDSTQSLTAKEIPTIQARLKDGQLVPLGLVYGTAGDKERGRVWQNHQVLAYRAVPRGGGVDLFVYDPNYPGDDAVVIRCVGSGTRPAAAGELGTRPNKKSVQTPGEREGFTQVRCEQVTGAGRVIAVRGVFAMPYGKQIPD